MSISNRKVSLYHAIVSAWAIISLLIAKDISHKMFSADKLPQLVGTWVILSVAPVLPAAWVWIMERTPWSLGFLMPVIVAGTLGATSAYNDADLETIAHTIVGWTIAASLGAWLLKGATQISAIGWKRYAKVPKFPIVSDHGRYLRMLDDQAVAGFPNVERVRQHFLTALPEVIPAFKDYGPIDGQEEFTAYRDHARKFMLGNVSCKLAFLCAISFLERMCGPDFRYTKQYQFLLETMIRVKAVSDEGPFKGLGDIAIYAVNTAALEGVVSALEKQREWAARKDGGRRLDTDVTVALTALYLLTKEGLLPAPLSDDFNANFTRMVKGGMNKMREMFSCQPTEVGVP